VFGSITITKIGWPGRTYFPREWAHVEAFVEYQGVAGSSGCNFVEGHVLLSLNTGIRFFYRGEMVRRSERNFGKDPNYRCWRSKIEYQVAVFVAGDNWLKV
jgi:hypothetical protein